MKGCGATIMWQIFSLCSKKARIFMQEWNKKYIIKNDTTKTILDVDLKKNLETATGELVDHLIEHNNI